MSTSEPVSKATAAYYIQSAIAFGVSFGSTLLGIVYLPLTTWQRGFLAVCMVFLVTSCFNLAKCVRDAHETQQVRHRIDEARLDKMFVEHNPLKTA
ncbi:hypothetical protein FZI91_08025 [Mycobacterium sp. CBMA271]|uniref:YiaA/YiaB family inner membrane protein n=1 Tax=unclassified Mycobacteroides TaxID=2618759 RepID=UPI0012DC2B08|nr:MULTISPECIES: YiaA/YiaB family inner membrane protein [unclassified Mycobacteroides]MUM19239.1 hypothetical protein [Mycobacteroides sp. CBMA 326]MUM21653.1 hypothetical protein [Mycobacteroides sp. CBMA 271]